MTEPLHEELSDAVDGLFGPTPIDKHSATFRVAVLYDGTGELGQAIRDAGLEVVYTREPDSPTEDFDFDRVPAFDFLIANLPGDSRDVLEFALRFLRVRRPAAFVLTGKERIDTGTEFERFFRGRAEQIHYELHSATLRARNGDTRSFVAGMPPRTLQRPARTVLPSGKVQGAARIPFSWPCGDLVDALDAGMLVMEVLERVGQSLLLQRT